MHLIVIGLYNSESCCNCLVPPPVGSSKVAFRIEKSRVKWPTELPAVLHLIRLSSLPCNGSWKGHSPLMESQEQGSKGSVWAFTPSYNGVLQALGELRKARSHWPYKTQTFSSQRAALCHSSSGCKQPAPSPVGLIRRKSHADTASSEIYWKEIWRSLNQQEAEGTSLENGKDQPRQWAPGAIWPRCWTPLLLWLVNQNES